MQDIFLCCINHGRRLSTDFLKQTKIVILNSRMWVPFASDGQLPAWPRHGSLSIRDFDSTLSLDVSTGVSAK